MNTVNTARVLLTAATMAAATPAIPTVVRAEGKKVLLESTNAPEDFVEWQGATGPNVVEVKIDETRRAMEVAAGTNSPVSIDGACPPPSSFPGWKLDISAEPAAGRDSAEVHSTAVDRTGDNGTFNLRTTAPSRAGQTLKTQVDCVRLGDDGKTVEDREPLDLSITAVGSDSGAEELADDADNFAYRGNEDGEPEEPNIQVNAGAACAIPMYGKPKPSVGVKAGFAGDPVAKGDALRFPIGAEYRYAEVSEQVTADGRQVNIGTPTHAGLLKVGWEPVVYDGVADVRLQIAALLGVGHAVEVKTRDGKVVPGKTGVVGGADVGVAIGGKNLALKAGGFVQGSSVQALNAWGPFVCAEGRF